jgi:hypothetical protein
MESYRDRNPDVVADKVHQLVQLRHDAPENPIEGRQMLVVLQQQPKGL